MKALLIVLLALGFIGSANASMTAAGTSVNPVAIPALGVLILASRDYPATNYQVVTCKAKNGNYYFDTTVTDAKANGLNCK